MNIWIKLKNAPLKCYYSLSLHSSVHTEFTYKHSKLTKQQKHVSIIPMSSGRLRSFTLMAPSYNKEKISENNFILKNGLHLRIKNSDRQFSLYDYVRQMYLYRLF